MPATRAQPAARQAVRIALLQHAAPPAGRSGAVPARTVAMIRAAAGQGAKVILTQELFTGPYFPQREDPRHFDLAEPIPGPTSSRLCRLARALRVSIVASIFEKRAPGLFHNTAIAIGPRGTIVGKYRKMHIPDDPRFFEKYYFTPGDLGWQAVPLPGLAVGLLVCWDQWYPEAARLTALRGAQLLAYPTAIAWHREDGPEVRRQQLEAWRTVQRSHAIANGVFVAAVNRIGVEGDLTFWGSSFVCDPGGTVIAQASADGEQVLLADLDPGRIDHYRQGWPFLRDRRIDAYGGLESRWLDG